METNELLITYLRIENMAMIGGSAWLIGIWILNNSKALLKSHLNLSKAYSFTYELKETVKTTSLINKMGLEFAYS